MVFDCFPMGSTSDMPVEERWEIMRERLGAPKTPDEVIWDSIPSSRASSSQSQPLLPFSSQVRKVIPLKHIRCSNSEDLAAFYHAVIIRGGEGAMLRGAGSGYYRGRSNKVLYKVKPAYDGEAKVEGYTAFREGKWDEDRSRIGSLVCRMASGVKFKVGSGLDSWERSSGAPPPGSIIKYRCYDLTPQVMKPRHPVYLGIDPDKTEPKDPEVASVKLRKLRVAKGEKSDTEA